MSRRLTLAFFTASVVVLGCDGAANQAPPSTPADNTATKAPDAKPPGVKGEAKKASADN
jgi:hypothetical protein